MRHFLALALAPLRLSPGMLHPAPKRLLVALACPADTRAPGLARTRRRAIPLAVIAAPAHPQLLLTARTVPHSVTDDVDRPTSSHKRLDAVGQSGHGQLRDTRTCRSQRRLPEGSRRSVLGPSPFAERVGVIAPATARKLGALQSVRARRRKGRKPNQIHEADGSRMW